MLTPEYLQGAPAELEALFLRLEEDIIKDICRRIAKIGAISESAEHEILRLKELGAGTDYIKEKIAEYSGLSDAAVDMLFFDAAQSSDEFYSEVYQKANVPYSPYEYNGFFQQAVNAAVNQTKGELRNLTQSMGFSYRGSNGQIRFHTAAEAYRDCLDYAVTQIAAGMTDYNTAIRNATRRLTDSGLQFVDYASGVKNHADVAARRAVLTGLSQYTGKIAERNMQELDTDIVEVDAHPGARPDHADWQGRWYSFSGKSKEYPSLVEVTGYGTVTGLKGANCRHDFYPVIPGISEPSYTEEELRNIDPPPFEYDGKTYTYYEATQRQRYMERSMRKTKRELLAADSTGDKDRFTEKSVLLRRQKEEYGKFSKAAGLLTQNERTQVAGFGRSEASRAAWAAKKGQSGSGGNAKNNPSSGLTNGGGSGMIKKRQLAQATEFNIMAYDVIEDLLSVESLKNYAADTMGIQYISGIDNLKNGTNAQIILSTVQVLSETYNKHFSRISFVDFGSEKTIAETLESELRLNFEFMNRPDALEAVLNEWVNIGYIPKGCNNCVYVAKHEYFHLLSQDSIDKNKSKVLTEIRRQKVPPVSENAKKNGHEYVAELLSANILTKQQQKLKDKIIRLILAEKG